MHQVRLTLLQLSLLMLSVAMFTALIATRTKLDFASMNDSLASYSSHHVKKSNDCSWPRGTYLSSLMMLSCFITPDCFPRRRCRTGIPMKIPREVEYEEQSFCVDDLNANRGNCIVYSFGIYGAAVEWESKVAKLFGCEVHAFDPTMNHPTDLAPGVTFHKLGLQGEGTDMSATKATIYKPIDPDKLMRLPKIMKDLGHDDRQLDVLMLDCEGCEWGVLKELACSGQSVRVKQLVIEFHFQKNMGLYGEDDVKIAAEAARCLWEERWNVVSIEPASAMAVDWDYAAGMSHILHESGMLLYIAMQRTPESERHISDLREDHIRQAQKQNEMVFDFKKSIRKGFLKDIKALEMNGTDEVIVQGILKDKTTQAMNRKNWPANVTEALNQQGQLKRNASQALEAALVQTLVMDDNPRLNESDYGSKAASP